MAHGLPVLFFPYIQNNEGVTLSQTPAILYYLRKHFGLFPEGDLFEEAQPYKSNECICDTQDSILLLYVII